MKRQRSSATPLALAYGLLVVYASLYPFDGWLWPPGQTLGTLLHLPWPRPWLPFDLWSNAAGYLPLGVLLTIAARRSGLSMRLALALGVLVPALLSLAMEFTQQFLPARHVSLKDSLMNLLGAIAGTAMAWAWLASGGVQRWHRWRERWFGNDASGALALLALWPLALLFPTPVPLGLGQVFDALRSLTMSAIDGVPWAEPAWQMLADSAVVADAAGSASPLAQLLVTALGLLAPCALACSVVAAPLRRVVLVLGATLLAFTALTLSTLLNFGPQHALAWLTTPAWQGRALGLLLSLALAPWPRRGAAALGLVALGGLVASVAQAPADPYVTQSLQAWEQGRFVRFHGITQWLGSLWPWLALLWLLLRVARAEPRLALGAKN
ncbi:MAG: VanZ family protein [Rubrivivax sp.]